MSEQNLYGTDSLKKVLRFFVKTTMSIIEANDDGKITTMEWLALAPGAVTNAITAVMNIKEAIPEWKDLIDAEREDLRVWMVDEFDLANEKAERIAEKIFKVILDIDSVVDEFVQNEPEAPVE